MTSAADRNNGNTHRLFFMKWILELYDGPYPEIPFERGRYLFSGKCRPSDKGGGGGGGAAPPTPPGGGGGGGGGGGLIIQTLR